jgi:hypothetical protein
MSAKESRTCCDHVPREAELGAGGVPATQTRDKRAQKQERGNVGAQRVHRTDPTLDT